MISVERLQAALAAVPVNQSCTGGAVGTLFTAGRAAAQQIANGSTTAQEQMQVRKACCQQQLPGACMPVLAWLAAGLRSGLSATATQQAHEMACVLLWVVSRSMPDDVESSQGNVGQHETALILQQLGTPEAMFQQLAQVVAALVDTSMPPTPASSSSSSSSSRMNSSRAVALLKLQESLSGALLQVACFLVLGLSYADREVLLPALTGSGLLQVLLDANLLLLTADPAAYPQMPEVQQQLWDTLRAAMNTGVTLTGQLAARVCKFLADGNTTSGHGPGDTACWMQPLFKLQILLLAKMQWDLRQCPEHSQPWPVKALTRAVTRMVSPSVAGDLLQQRAPGLVPHKQSCRRWVHTLNRQRWEVKEECLYRVTVPCLEHIHQGLYFMWQLHEDHPPSVAPDAQELALVMESAELYCLVCPTGSPVFLHAWRAHNAGLHVLLHCSAEGVPAAFTATCGEALVSIAEYLVEDVMLVMVGEGPGAVNKRSGANSSSSSSSKPAAEVAAASAPDAGPPATTSSRPTARRPTAGGKNPEVALKHRMRWAEAAMYALGMLLGQRHLRRKTRQGATAAQALIGRTAPRLRLLLETTLRTPSVLTRALLPFFHLLPRTLPALHAAANSPAGSRALLSAAITAAKRQRVTNAALVALVEAGGGLAPAAATAAVVAAVPGLLGGGLAQQVLEHPTGFLEAAYALGMQLLILADELLFRAAALLDPLAAPAAAYLAARLPTGQGSQLAGLEAFLTSFVRGSDGEERTFPYLDVLATSPDEVRDITEKLVAAIRELQAGLEIHRAAKLAGRLEGAADAKQLLEQLGGQQPQHEEGKPCAQPQQVTEDERAVTMATAPVSSSSIPGYGHHAEQLPAMLRIMCDHDHLQLEEVLAAGDPGQWAAAVTPPSSADLRVAATAVLMAFKVAGAVAQLPQRLEQLLGIIAQQPWGRDVPSEIEYFDLAHMKQDYSKMAIWALLMEPVLALLLPAQQAAQLQAEVTSVRRDAQGRPQVTPDVAGRVLGLLQYVALPGAPGCSWPGCCNLEGRTEAELPVQACTKCRGVRYCCREHQVAHWKAGHKEECKLAQAAAECMLQAAAQASNQASGSSM